VAGTTNGQRGGGRRPVDSKTRARVEALGRAGQMSRNAIAKDVGISPSTVTRICREATPPITFDRSATAVAVEARQLDLKAERARISARLIAEIDGLFDKMHAPHVVVGWYEGSASEHVLDQPTSGDVKNYATTLGILLDKHLALVKHDSDDRDKPAVDKWLEALGVPIAAA
jgi:DNA-binding Lrp family transcriptional regulator